MSREVVTVTIPSEVVEKLDAVAESEYRSRSSLVTQLIAQGLATRNPQPRCRSSSSDRSLYASHESN